MVLFWGVASAPTPVFDQIVYILTDSKVIVVLSASPCPNRRRFAFLLRNLIDGLAQPRRLFGSLLSKIKVAFLIAHTDLNDITQSLPPNHS